MTFYAFFGSELPEPSGFLSVHTCVSMRDCMVKVCQYDISQSCLWKFHHIFKSGPGGDKDELVRLLSVVAPAQQWSQVIF